VEATLPEPSSNKHVVEMTEQANSMIGTRYRHMTEAAEGI
jgi:hypothetical protein